ncbi:hypothetical protein N9994_00160 [bacterium]|nr:hypothetical protein [bacterium]
MGNKRRNHLNLRQTSTTHGDVNKKQMLSFKELDDNFIFLKERDVKEIKLTGNDLVYETLGGDEITVDLSSLGGGGGSSLWTESGDDIRFDTGDVYIGWRYNYKHLHVNGEINSGLGFKVGSYEYGVPGSGIINSYGGTSTGNFSATLGAGNTATGLATLAIGTNVTASGEHSFAGGYSPYSGFDVVASGEASFAFLESTNNHPQVGAMSDNSVTLGGKDNIVYSDSNPHSSILGGRDNVISGGSEYSTIIGGRDNRLESNSYSSVILGGEDIVATEAMTAYVSRLNIGSVGNETPNKLLAVDSNGKVVDGSSLASGGGDVSKVGTPSNNQVGVWTGDGTIEGDSNFTWNGSTLEVANADHYSRIHPNYLYQLNESADANLLLYTKSNGTSVGSEIIFGRWNGTIGSESPLVSGQLISAQRMMGSHDVSNPTNVTTGALIEVRTAENWTATAKGVRYSIDTAAIGENATTERFAIDSDGSVKITGDLIVNDDTYFDGAILQTGINYYGTSDNAINLTNKSIVRIELNNTITGPSIGAGTAGQRIILYVDSGTGNTTIDVTNGLDFTEIVFSSIADSVEMIYDNNKWLILSSRGATIS